MLKTHPSWVWQLCSGPPLLFALGKSLAMPDAALQGHGILRAMSTYDVMHPAIDLLNRSDVYAVPPRHEKTPGSNAGKQPISRLDVSVPDNAIPVRLVVEMMISLTLMRSCHADLCPPVSYASFAPYHCHAAAMITLVSSVDTTTNEGYFYV